MKTVESLSIVDQCLHLTLSNSLRGSLNNVRALEFSQNAFGFTFERDVMIIWWKKDAKEIQVQIDELLKD